MADFLKAFIRTGGHEGGYADDPTDRGGETYRGISRRYHPGWYGWEIVDSYKDDPHFPDILALDDDLAYRVERFYENEYWGAMNLGRIKSQQLADELFDTAVNMGTTRAAKFLQEALNLTNRCGRDYADLVEDGIIGKVTIGKANWHKDPRNVIKTINILQGYHYIKQCRLVPSQERYFNGWLKRIEL